ncbi:MAG TPA: hypothetical protein VHY58_01755 [Streptosporangiaceae bacterium]|jgi:hypothetical protein|nr:hypothetical protein [Streptosporangiaceae bacterium]
MSYGVATPPRRRRWRTWLFVVVGVVVGLVVVLTVVGLVVNTGSPPKPNITDAPKATGLVRLHFGQKATLSQGWTSDGIVSATVYGFQTPFTSQTDNRPDAGDQYAVSPVQVCAGPHGADTTTQLLAFPFQLVYPHSQTFGVLDGPDAAKEPDVSNVGATLHANQCVRAYATFQFAKGKPPLAVGWGSPDQPAYEWTAAGG